MCRTRELAREKLAELESQRAELDETIEDLRAQVKWGEELIASLQNPDQQAAE